MKPIRRLTPIVLVLLDAAAVVALWTQRPPWPQLPTSLDLPVTTTFIQRLLLTAAWLALLLLLAIIAIRATQTARRRRRRVPIALPARRRPERGGALEAVGSSPPFPLIVPGADDTVPKRIGSLSLRLDLQLPAVIPQSDAAATSTDPPSGSHPKPPIRISLLGPFTIDGAPTPRRSSTRELITYLALHPEGATRDQLLEALWPDADPRRTRPRLWQSTAEARRMLDDAFILDDNGRYRLDRQIVWVDSDELPRLLDQANSADAATAATAVEKALALWRGDPLDGADYRWAETDVRRLRATQTDLLLRGGTTHLADGDARGGLDAAERGIEIDQLHEPFWRLALEAEGLLGLREAVTRALRDAHAAA
jgi:DNA-binding SARP family transcriptional activator